MERRDPGILDAASHDTWRGTASFTLSNRVYRMSFALTWLLLARWTPPQWHGWRRRLLQVFGAQLAPTARVYPSVAIWSPANLEMGEYAAIGPRADVYSMAPVILEAYALVSQGARLCAGTHDIESPNFQLRSLPIRIEARAWIAAEAFVGPGVTVGRGAVLGARGCAFRNLEPWTVYAGNPAKALKPRHVRFPDCPQ